MKVNLILEGDKDEVMSVVGIALEAGVMTSMHTEDEVAPVVSRPSALAMRMSKDTYLAKFDIGGAVVLRSTRADHPDLPEVGTAGTVVGKKRSGRGGTVHVQWDGTNKKSWVPSSLLDTTRRRNGT